MKARYLTAKEIKVAKAVARDIAEHELDGAAYRAQCLWMAAMLNAGFTVDDVHNVMRALPEVLEKYGEYKEDGVADYALYSELNNAGLSVEIPKNSFDR